MNKIYEEIIRQFHYRTEKYPSRWIFHEKVPEQVTKRIIRYIMGALFGGFGEPVQCLGDDLKQFCDKKNP